MARSIAWGESGAARRLSFGAGTPGDILGAALSSCPISRTATNKAEQARIQNQCATWNGSSKTSQFHENRTAVFAIARAQPARMTAGSGTQRPHHARVRNGLAHMRQMADPGHGTLEAHAEAGMGDAAVLADVQVPLVVGAVELVVFDLVQEILEAGCALAAADDFAVAFRGQQVGAQGQA